jgi:hypothetical protein
VKPGGLFVSSAIGAGASRCSSLWVGTSTRSLPGPLSAQAARMLTDEAVVNPIDADTVLGSKSLVVKVTFYPGEKPAKKAKIR